MGHKLYVKIGEKFEELAAVGLLPGLDVVKKTSVQDAILKYVSICTSKKAQKNQSVEKLYFLIFKQFLADKKIIFIDKVEKSHIDEFESSLLDRMKASSVNRRFNTFKNFFAKCKEWKLIVENPCHGMKKRKEIANPRKPWTFEIFKRFIDQCSGVEKSIFIFLWLTGCRPMEVKNFKWTDINYDEKLIYLRCGKNKEVVREFPLTKEIDILLHSLKIDSVWVFSKDKKQISNDRLYHYCKKRFKRLGINNLSPYGARHGFGTKLANEGVSAFYIASLMGHKKLETTQKYIHSEKNQLISILSKVK